VAGFESFQKAAAQAQERKAAFGEGFVKFARFQPNHPYTVRFLEQGDDVQWAYVHEIPALPGKVAKVTPCLNQDDAGIPCYGCEQGAKRLIKGWINLIMRDAPVYLSDNNGVPVKDPITSQYKIIGTSDQVQVWNSGTTLFSTLAQKDRAFKGLMSRDFTVVRTGQGFDTNYAIDPADPDGGPQAMSEDDRKLAAEKFNVRKFTIPETYDVQKQLLQGVPLAQIKRSEDAVAAAASSNVLGDSNAFDRAFAKMQEASA